MGQLQFKLQERRMVERRELTGLMPGRIRYVDSKKEIATKPVDVSTHGLGLIIDEQIAVGTHLELVVKDKVIPLEVAWGQPDFGKRDLFRYGLVTLNPKDDLEQVFLAAGCLR